LAAQWCKITAIVAINYGGTQVDEDVRDRKVVDEWFRNKYTLRLLKKDMEVTSKYRFDEKFNTGGTFGVNFAGVGGLDHSLQLSHERLE